MNSPTVANFKVPMTITGSHSSSVTSEELGQKLVVDYPAHHRVKEMRLVAREWLTSWIIEPEGRKASEDR